MAITKYLRHNSLSYTGLSVTEDVEVKHALNRKGKIRVNLRSSNNIFRRKIKSITHK